MNRQHNDIGTQYRSVIFFFDQSQELTAKKVIQELDLKKVFSRKIVTEVLAAPKFYSAEEYHQDYLIKNPDGYMCHILRDSK